MILIKLYIILCIFLCILVQLHCEKHTKKLKGNLSLFSNYEIHTRENLPSDKQISTFIFKGNTQIFSYFSTSNNSPLSVTVITCTSSLNWSIKFHQTNSSELHYREEEIQNLTTKDTQTYHLKSMKGTYRIHVRANDRDTYVHIYVSTEFGGPQTFQNLDTRNVLKLLKRRQQKRISIRWEQSLVDPQVTDYCLVISTRRNYMTYCSAYGERFGITPPKSKNELSAASQTVMAWDADLKDEQNEPFIVCVGSKTHFTFSDLRSNQGYYFDLFAFNKQSNLTYLYGSSFMIFNKRTKPIRLKDNKSTYVNLKKFDGKIVFRYKVGQLLSDSLKIYVIPCGGSVDIHVSSKGKMTSTKRRIDSFGMLVMPTPKVGSSYYIKILSTNNEELRRTSGVEILATTKSSTRTSLPSMPLETSVFEYISLRQCNSVTVGWLASPGQKVVRYCLIVREGQLKEFEIYKTPNQCGLENRMRKSADFKAKYCRDVNQENEEVLIQEIGHLKPGKSYVVQVTVKKPKGKTLSYELLQVHTKPTCENPLILS